MIDGVYDLAEVVAVVRTRSGSSADGPPSAPPQRPTGPATACLNLNTGESAADFQRHPGYAEACRAWHERLSDDQNDLALHTVDAFLKWGEGYGRRWAAHLPPRHRGVRSISVSLVFSFHTNLFES